MCQQGECQQGEAWWGRLRVGYVQDPFAYACKVHRRQQSVPSLSSSKLLLASIALACQMPFRLTCLPVCIRAENRPANPNLPSPGGLMTQMVKVHDQQRMLAVSGLHLPAISAADGLRGFCSIFASPARVQPACTPVQPASERIKFLGVGCPLTGCTSAQPFQNVSRPHDKQAAHCCSGCRSHQHRVTSLWWCWPLLAATWSCPR